MSAKTVQSLFSCECGATAIEYALIAMGVGVAIIAATFALGTELVNTFTDVRDLLQGRP
ncbi:conserved hypothetical protein [Rhodospirillaceae bacterium LM-1]|nr:conserved hypothetical protein [Rhodospirillaceae bacterium LM-1]